MQRASFARELRFWLFSFFVRTAEVLIDCIEYYVQVCEHLAIPESKHSVAVRLQKGSASFIFMRKMRVLGAIEFNDETPFDRAEVGEVGTDRVLAAKFCVPHSAASQMSPEDSFCVGLFCAQSSSIALG
jgi:hypothetical protein